MSDDFSRCSSCNGWDCLRLKTKSNPESDDDGSPEDIFECELCGETCRRDEIRSTHVEYMNGRVVD